MRAMASAKPTSGKREFIQGPGGAIGLGHDHSEDSCAVLGRPECGGGQQVLRGTLPAIGGRDFEGVEHGDIAVDGDICDPGGTVICAGQDGSKAGRDKDVFYRMTRLGLEGLKAPVPIQKSWAKPKNVGASELGLKASPSENLAAARLDSAKK